MQLFFYIWRLSQYCTAVSNEHEVLLLSNTYLPKPARHAVLSGYLWTSHLDQHVCFFKPDITVWVRHTSRVYSASNSQATSVHFTNIIKVVCAVHICMYTYTNKYSRAVLRPWFNSKHQEKSRMPKLGLEKITQTFQSTNLSLGAVSSSLSTLSFV